MKKISLFAAMVMTTFVVSAQNMNVGLKGGLNLASLSDSENEDDVKSRIGYHAGLFLNIAVSPQIAIQPEAVYSVQGAKYDLGTPGDDLQFTLNYVNIPVMVQAMVGKGFYAEAGPQLGILTSVSDKVGDMELNSVSKDDFKTTDVSLGFGLGYKGISGFGLDARYNIGLTDINNSGRSANIKNNVMQIGLSLQLGGSGRR